MTELFETKSKPLPITKEMVKMAYRKVKSGGKSGGVDQLSLEEFEKNLLGNLYKIWNRLSSGSYFPPAVREVQIPKSDGKKRTLGIPTIGDRIAQQVIKSFIEPGIESHFHKSSFGYRPLKNAHEAIKQVRENVWKYSWVIDLDIKNFFDEVDHELLMKALDIHVEAKWAKMYIQRWLEAPSQNQEGNLIEKAGKGTPQGGVISPLLSNLYLHYTLDKWLEKNYPEVAFVRYADDIVIHCESEQQAQQVYEAVKDRLTQCKLRLNEEKTQIVCCKGFQKEKKHYRRKFDFLGFSFKPDSKASKYGGMYLGYDCAVSVKSKRRILESWKKMIDATLWVKNIQQFAVIVNSRVRGVYQYYGKIKLETMRNLTWYLNRLIIKWVWIKYKRFNGKLKKTYAWLIRLCKFYPNLFYHWQLFRLV